MTRIQLNHSLMDIRDIIKPDITGLAKRAKFRPKLVPSIYSKHPNPSPPCTEPFDRAKFGSRFIQVIHRAAASIQHHLLSPPLLELDIRNSPPLPAFPRHLIVALWIAKFTRFAFAPVADNKLSRENGGEKRGLEEEGAATKPPSTKTGVHLP